MTHTYDSSRALTKLHGIATNLDWFTALCLVKVIIEGLDAKT